MAMILLANVSALSVSLDSPEAPIGNVVGNGAAADGSRATTEIRRVPADRRW